MPKKPSPLEIIEFIETVQNLKVGVSGKTKLISLKVPESLLKAFKIQCEEKGYRYQTQIKKLMAEWLTNEENRTHLSSAGIR